MSSILKPTPASIQNTLKGSDIGFKDNSNIHHHDEDTIINDSMASTTTTTTTIANTSKNIQPDCTTADSSISSGFLSSNNKFLTSRNQSVVDHDLSKKVSELITFCKNLNLSKNPSSKSSNYIIYDDSWKLKTDIEKALTCKNVNLAHIINLLAESLSKVNSSLNYYKLECMLSDENNDFLKGRNEVETTINLKNMEVLNVINFQNAISNNSNLDSQDLKRHKYESLKKIVDDKVDSFEKLNSKIEELSNKALKYKIKYNAMKELLHEKDLQLKKLQKTKNNKESSPSNVSYSANLSNSNITPSKFKIYQHQFYNNGASHSTTPVSSNQTFSKTPKRSRKKRNSSDNSKNSILTSSTIKPKNQINIQDMTHIQEEETIIQNSPDQTILAQSPEFEEQNNSSGGSDNENAVNSTPFLPSSICFSSSVASKKRSLSGAAATSSSPSIKLPPVFGPQNKPPKSSHSTTESHNIALGSLVSYSTAPHPQSSYKTKVPLFTSNKNKNTTIDPQSRLGSLQYRAKSSGSFFDTLNMLASQAVLVSSSAAASYERSNMTSTFSSLRSASTGAHKFRKIAHDSTAFNYPHLQPQQQQQQRTSVVRSLAVRTDSRKTKRTFSTSSSGSNHSASSDSPSSSGVNGGTFISNPNNNSASQNNNVKLPGISQILGSGNNNNENNHAVLDEPQKDYAYSQRNYDLNSNDTIDEDQGY